jgi:putative protease
LTGAGPVITKAATTVTQPHHEILAPAGDEDCLRAAVGAGADAVYFGLSVGFNARAKAPSFAPGDLRRVFDWLHERGVKGFVTFNTVVFDSELDAACDLLGIISEAGADAIIVQDLGVARLARAVVPDLPVHASTQMTISSPEAAAVAAELGAVRIILPRELSVEEIRRFRANTTLDLECFVHGALCVSYSGQCLTSEAWGQRSANRGQCAQSCRLAYDLVLDGKKVDRGVERYLLSPKDLAAYNLLGDLVEAGVSCFKIEGRYKGPDYVAGAVEKYRRALDLVLAGKKPELTLADREDLAFTFSRGFSTGWLAGDDHQALNHGKYPGHRGLFVGQVVDIRGYKVFVRLASDAPALKPGDWMVFGQGDPEGDEPTGGVFGVGETLRGVQEVRFGEPGPDLTRVKPGDELWKSHDPAVKKRLLRYGEAERRVEVNVIVSGRAGAPLVVAAEDALGRRARVEGPVLEAARTRPLDAGIIKEKLASFGDTRWRLGKLRLELEGALATSPAALKRLRRELVAALEAQAAVPPPPRRKLAVDVRELGTAPQPRAAVDPVVVPLCRTLEQVDAALASGARELYVDMMELVGLRDAVARCKQAGARVAIATMRIQKPGEEPIDASFERLQPDGILARHLGALEHYRHLVRPGFELHGDFSLNCTNAITGRTLLGMGLATLTPSYDLNLEQLEELARGLPPARLEVTVHQHLPLYHTEYCLYAHNLSKGADYRTCGRPCESHRLHLGDVKGQQHPIIVDVHCRNTVFNAQAQSAARHIGRILAAGVRRLRVELVWESAAETSKVLAIYGDLVAGRRGPAEVLGELGAIERYGVTAGTLQVMSRPALKVVG